MSLPISSRPNSSPLPRPDRIPNAEARRPAPKPAPVEVHDFRPRTAAPARPAGSADRLERQATLTNNHLGTQLAASSGQATQQRVTPRSNSTWGVQVRELPNGGTLTTTTSQAPGLSSSQTVLNIPTLPSANSERVVTQRELPNGGTLTTESLNGTSQASRVDIPGVARPEDRARQAIEEVFQGGFIQEKSKWDIAREVVSGLNPYSLENQVNFLQGAFNAATSTAGTLLGNPLATVKGVGDLVTNPLLNPVTTLITSAVQGESPVPRYHEGWNQLYGMGNSVVDDYQTEYADNGSAGVAGSIGFDVAMAFLPGGAGASTARQVATTAASAFKPSASDIAAAAASGAGDDVSLGEAIGAWLPG